MIKALTKLFCHWIHIGKRFVVSVRKKFKEPNKIGRKKELCLVIQMS